MSVAREMLELAEKAEAGPDDLNVVNLIKDGPNEILAKTLQSFRVNDKTAKQKRYLDEIERSFVRAFVNLCWKLPEIGISEKQIAEILNGGEEYIVLLNNYIDQKTKFLTRVQKIMLYGSVVGLIVVWAIWLDRFYGKKLTDSWTYQTTRKILEKAYGKGYFPTETLRNKLHP